MSHGIYQATAGAVARQNQIDVAANNIANVDTPGHREQKVTFEGVLQRANAPASHMVISSGTVLDTEPGVPNQTGRPLDFALGHRGYVLAENAGGKVALLRTARVEQDEQGFLVAGQYRFIDRSGLPIRTDRRLPIQLVEDGRVMQGESVVGRLKIQRVEREEYLESLGAGAYGVNEDSGEPFGADNRLVVGYLEGSNANVLEGMVKLIHLERGYQAAMKAIQAYREADEKLIERTSR